MNSRALVYRVVAINIMVWASAVAIFVLFPGRTARLITDLYPPVLSGLSTWLAYRIYRSLERGQQARRIWMLLAVAMGLWTLAEMGWALYDFFLPIAPYPSWTDLLYLVGGLFLVAFFVVQVRFLRLALRGWKAFLAMGLILLFLVVAGVLVYAPMFARPSRDWLTFSVNLLYETEYLLILIGSTVLALAVHEGILGRRWVVLVAGLWLDALSSQMFFYANWYGLYYPGDQATFLSVACDLLYIAGDLLILSGLYLRWALPFPALQVEEILVSMPKFRPQETWVLLSDRNGRISFVDPRLPPVLGTTDVGAFLGEFAGAALGLRTDLDEQILEEVQAQGYSQPRKVLLAGQFYALQTMREPETTSGEIYWLLTPWEARLELRPEERPALEALLAQAVRGTARISGAWVQAYFQAVFHLLSLLCARSGGEEVRLQFVRRFGPQACVCEEIWQSGRLEDIGVCRELLQQILEYTLVVAPADQVNSALRRLEAGLGEEVIRAAEAFGLRLKVS
ncbi:MAG: hypothetical protein RML46_05245 [Anaerolineae bacterium]|nr:hypothetical protein [Anaerolineae bacterium]MDW8068300.1 hypothetical protein [Anaerolineae bacterium]